MVQRVARNPKPRPRFIEPMECKRVPKLPEGDAWVYEPKQDGYRIIAVIDGSTVVLHSMSGLNYTAKYPHIAAVSTVRGSGWVSQRRLIHSSPMPDIPLAYLITFRSYGTWLHGDERGSIDRHQNQYLSPYIVPNPNWHAYNLRHLTQAPVTLTDLQRVSVGTAIRETCRFRSWELKAMNVRTNHVHALVSTGSLKPERVLNALKANATRQLRQDGYWLHAHTPWADGGSRRYIWTDVGIERATDYVVNGQEGEMPDFDSPGSPIRYRGRY